MINLKQEYIQLRAGNLSKEIRKRLEIEGYDKADRTAIYRWLKEALDIEEDAT